jgi:hypothetical protein
MFRKLALGLSIVGLIGVSWWSAEHVARAKTKAQFLRPSSDPGDRHTEKVTGPIAVRMELEGPAPESVGDLYKVVGYVQSSTPLDNVRLAWNISGTAQLVSGVAHETIRLAADTETRVEITLKAIRPGAQRVQLRAAATHQGARFAAAAHYTNRPPVRDFENKKETLGDEKPEGSSEQKIFQ